MTALTLSQTQRWVSRYRPAARRYKDPTALGLRLDPTLRYGPAHQAIADAIVGMFAVPGRRNIAVYMPPQEGKSELISRRTPEWLLDWDPTLRIGVVSYELEAAARWGRTIKRDVDSDPEAFPSLRIRADSRAASRWETTAGGGVYCVGVRGALTGRPLDVLIIDDPFKDRPSAESGLERDRVWSFWEEVGRPRLSPRAKVLLVQTRWHHDDLGGRLEEREPDDWTVISIPAIADRPDDPLGRALGAEFPSVRGREDGYFYGLRDRMSAYAFSALYQQAPTQAEGLLFKRSDWRRWEVLPSGQWLVNDRNVDPQDCHRFMTVDLAASTRTSSDWTVACAWAITPAGDVLLLGRARDRVEEGDHFKLVDDLRRDWLGPYDVVHIEKNMIGSTLVYEAGQHGIPFSPLTADVDKLTRALPAASLLRQGKLHLPRTAGWLDEWLDEHAEFDKGKHDDQVDNTAYAARVAIAHWIPPEPPNLARRHKAEGFDPMTVRY